MMSCAQTSEILQSYLKDVVNYAGSKNLREIADFNLKSYSILEENHAQLHGLIGSLKDPSYSMSLIAIYSVKIWHCAESEVRQLLVDIEEIMPILIPDHVMIYCLPLVMSLFEGVCERSIRSSLIVYGIRVLMEGIDCFFEEPDALNPFHSMLFNLCLEGVIFEPALLYLEKSFIKISVDLVELAQHDYAERWILLYLYYAGLIFGALDRYEDAYYMYERAVCLPIRELSAIAIDACKKAIIVSLIVYGRIKDLPSYRAPAVSSHLPTQCVEYFELEKLSKQKSDVVPGAILAHISQNRAKFERDNNLGLLNLYVRVLREQAVIRMTKVFKSVELKMLADKCRFDSVDHIVLYVIDLTTDGSIDAKIDDVTQIVTFEEVEEENPISNVIYASIDEIMELEKLVDHVCSEFPSNTTHSSEMVKTGFGTAIDDEGFPQILAPGAFSDSIF